MWGTDKEQNTQSQRKTPLILSSSYKCKNRSLRKGKGLVFSLADSSCLLRKVVIVCFSTVAHAILLQSECVYISKTEGKIVNKPRVQPGLLASNVMGLKASPESTFCRGSNCRLVLLIQSPRGCSCPGHCVLFFLILILLIYLFWLCCGRRDLSSWPMDSISVSQAPEHVGSVVATCGLSCSTACGILVPPFSSSHSVMSGSL